VRRVVQEPPAAAADAPREASGAGVNSLPRFLLLLSFLSFVEFC
jgi:hypothetical protein